jgi:hypothetical protein
VDFAVGQAQDYLIADIDTEITSEVDGYNNPPTDSYFGNNIAHCHFS